MKLLPATLNLAILVHWVVGGEELVVKKELSFKKVDNGDGDDWEPGDEFQDSFREQSAKVDYSVGENSIGLDNNFGEGKKIKNSFVEKSARYEESLGSDGGDYKMRWNGRGNGEEGMKMDLDGFAEEDMRLDARDSENLVLNRGDSTFEMKSTKFDGRDGKSTSLDERGKSTTLKGKGSNYEAVESMVVEEGKMKSDGGDNTPGEDSVGFDDFGEDNYVGVKRFVEKGATFNSFGDEVDRLDNIFEDKSTELDAEGIDEMTVLNEGDSFVEESMEYVGKEENFDGMDDEEESMTYVGKEEKSVSFDGMDESMTYVGKEEKSVSFDGMDESMEYVGKEEKSMGFDGMDDEDESMTYVGKEEKSMSFDGMDDDFGETMTRLDGKGDNFEFVEEDITLDDDFGEQDMFGGTGSKIKLGDGDGNFGMGLSDDKSVGSEESYDSSEMRVGSIEKWHDRDDDSFVQSKVEIEHRQVEGKKGGEQVSADKWNFDNEDPSSKEWELTDSDINFRRSMSKKGKMRETVEKWDTAEEDLIKIGGRKTLDLVDKAWKSEDIASIKVPPISFTEGYNFKKKWRELSKSNVMDDLQAMADLQSKIISTLKKIERTSKENKNCNLRDLDKQKEAVAYLEESLDLEPTVSETDLRYYLGRRSDRSVPDANWKDQQNEIIEELNKFEMLNKGADKKKTGVKAKSDIPQFDLCAEVKKGEKELQDASRQLRHKVVERRENVLKTLNNLMSTKSHVADVGEKTPQPEVSKTVVVHVEPNIVRVAGTVSAERCARCEELDNEEVCGDNGKTYRTLCHAVNCGGLALKDIATGSCAAKDVCDKAKCPSNRLCIPMNKGTCLSLYSSDGLRKLPCRQYICVDSKETCDKMNFTEVCGTDHKTYNSLCRMHKAGERLAYTGPCRPVCKGEVCGIDKNTYQSACHARTHNTKVDYSGKCFSKKSLGELLVPTCTAVRFLGRCHKEALCNKPVLPLDVCCPICGGVAQIRLDIAALSGFISDHEEKNHLYVLENMLREMLPTYAAHKCDVSVSLTNNGNISLILEAANPGDHQLCQDATSSVINSINSGSTRTHPGSNEIPRNVDTPRKFEMAAFLSVDSWLRDQVVGVQDRIIETADDLRNQANVKLSDTLLTVDDKVQNLPSKGHATSSTASILVLFHALSLFV